MFDTRMNMNSENTSGKNLIPPSPVVLRCVGDELVGELGDRLDPGRHDVARCRGAEHQRRGDADRDHHVEAQNW